MCTYLLRETVHGGHGFVDAVGVPDEYVSSERNCAWWSNSFVDVGGVPDVYKPSERSCVWY